jgi:hypothetical protein
MNKMTTKQAKMCIKATVIATAISVFAINAVLVSCKSKIPTTAEYAVDDDADKYADCFGAVDGMFFSSENVVEALDYNDSCYIIYDDVDAGMDNELIRVDRETFELIGAARVSKTGRLTGTLKVNDEFTPYETYSYVHE